VCSKEYDTKAVNPRETACCCTKTLSNSSTAAIDTNAAMLLLRLCVCCDTLRGATNDTMPLPPPGPYSHASVLLCATALKASFE
jgi:hypothetical protein